MKLGELRSAIRKTKGNPIVKVPLVDGTIFTLTLQKTPLMEELERAYPGGKGVETGLTFNEETGLLIGKGIEQKSVIVDLPTPAVDQEAFSDEDEHQLAAIRAQLGESPDDLLEEDEEQADDDLLV